jgi:hypothetical protein
VARRVDEDIDPLFPDEESSGLFGVQQPVEDEETAREQANELESVIEAHADAPTTPRALLEDVLETVDSPAYGPMEFDSHGRPDAMDRLTNTFDEAESVLDREFEDIVDETVERGFH